MLKPLYCRECGATLPSDSQFCPSCGVALGLAQGSVSRSPFTPPVQDGITHEGSGAPPPQPGSLLPRSHNVPTTVVWLAILALFLFGSVGGLGVYHAFTGRWPWSVTHSRGNEWSVQNSGTSQELFAVAWSGFQFVAVGGPTILTSPDGRTWTPQASGASPFLDGVVWSGSQFVAVGGPTILTSPDGRTWTPQASGTPKFLEGVVWSGTQFVAVGTPGTILTSPDGRTWTAQISGTSEGLDGVSGSGSQFVAVGGSGMILTSPNGRTWTARNSGTSGWLTGVAWSGTQFVVVGVAIGGSSSIILTSPDGRTWTPHRTSQNLHGVPVATGQKPTLIQGLRGVVWSGTQFVAVGYSGTILTSPDGRTWTAQISGTSEALYGVSWSGSQFVVVGVAGTILTSP